MPKNSDLDESIIEKSKLTATFLNGVALAMVSIGFVAPLVADLYGAVGSPPINAVLFWGPVWLIGGVMMHYTAAAVLKDLDG